MARDDPAGLATPATTTPGDPEYRRWQRLEHVGDHLPRSGGRSASWALGGCRDPRFVPARTWVRGWAQFLQLVMGCSPLQAGIRTLAWTAMPLFIAPAAGALSDRIGGRPIMAFGLALDAIAFAWIAYNAKVGMSYGELLPAQVLAGIGTASFFATGANVLMTAVRPEEAGQASGATNAIREIGGVRGVAVLAAVFTNRGGYQTPGTFVNGLTPALTIGRHLEAAA